MKTHWLETIKRPKCIHCGKELRKYTSTFWSDVKLPLGTVLLAGTQGSARFGKVEVLDRDIIVVSCRRSGIGTGGVWACGVFSGNFGAMADNYFCRQGCGYRYGLAKARLAVKFQ